MKRAGPSKTQTFPALIDTGASGTCISQNVAQATGIQPIGMRQLISATHTTAVNSYLVDMVIPMGGLGMIVEGAMVMEFSPHSNSPFQILVGRDIICKGVFTMSFDGHFTLAL